MNLTISCTHELKAEKVDIILMQKCSNNPKAALNFLQKMSAGKQSTSEFFSTHPSDSTRIQEIQKILQN